MRMRYGCKIVALVSLVLLASVMNVAQTPPAQAPTPPTLPTVPAYVAPGWQAVLAGQTPLRVLLISHKSMLAWIGDGEVQAQQAETGTVLDTAKAKETVGIVRVPEDKTCWLRRNGQNFCAVPSIIRLTSSKPYKIWSPNPDATVTVSGAVIITPLADGTFSVAREMLLDDYLRNILPAEMPKSFHPEAQKAQAVVARTYTLAKLGRHADEGADLCATVHCQAYVPEAARTPEADAALNATRGLILLAGEKLAEPYYHACCGGISDDAGYVWGPEYARPYLTGVLDAKIAKPPAEATVQELLAAGDSFCKHSNSARWKKTFTSAEIDALVAKNLRTVTGDATAQIKKVSSLAIESRTPFGRVATLRVEGDGASFLIFGDQARWLFGDGTPGPNGLWSTLFELTLTRDAKGNLISCTFTGAGRGHGIGLCQWGADGRGKAGQSFRDILHAYYPGTRLSDERK